MPTIRTPGRKAQRQNILLALVDLDLANHEVAHQPLVGAVTLPTDQQRIEFGAHSLIDWCVDFDRIMKASNYTPGAVLAKKGSGRMSYPSNIDLELDGQPVGKLRDRQVFVPNFGGSNDLVRWVEATSLRLNPDLTARERLGLKLRVADPALLITLHSEWSRRKALEENAINAVTLLGNGAEAYAK